MELRVGAAKGAGDLVGAVVGWLQEVCSGLSVGRCIRGLVTTWFGSKLGLQLWRQYSVLRHPNLPHVDLGWPLFGHTFEVVGGGGKLAACTARLLHGREAVMTNFLFMNSVIMTYPLYMKYLHKAELDGEFTPLFPPSFQAMLGPNSVFVLPGGKGCNLHKRLRNKILASMGPKQTLAMTDELLKLLRSTLDNMAAKTADEGHCTFVDVAQQIAARASALPITAGLSRDMQLRLEPLLEEVAAGLMVIPLNLGRFTQYGRSLRARREIVQVIEQIMQSPPQGQQNTITDLTKASEDGGAFTLDEVVDTCVTLLVNGMLTTADTLPTLFVELSLRQDWAKKIAAEEPLTPTNIESESTTLRFIREVMRIHPPVAAINRKCARTLDLGEHGSIPPGCRFVGIFKETLSAMGADFNPDRWTPESARENLNFGGNQPHSCIGKNLALLELQLFARVLCREYDIQALDTQPASSPRKPLGLTYANMLRVKVSHKSKA